MSKTLANACLFTFFIMHTLIALAIEVPHIYITHVSINEVYFKIEILYYNLYHMKHFLKFGGKSSVIC